MQIENITFEIKVWFWLTNIYMFELFALVYTIEFKLTHWPYPMKRLISYLTFSLRKLRA